MKYLTVLLVALSLFACTSSNDTNELAAQLAITVATQKVVAGDEVRAEKVREIAADARRFLDGEVVTLDALSRAVHERLEAEDLSPVDAQLADILVSAITLELARRVGGDELNAEAKIAVDKVLRWVIAAANVSNQ